MAEEAKHIVAGILAHVDAGKTTLSEALLYESGKIRKRGRVDHADAYLDTTDLERQRGITMMAHQTQLQYQNLRLSILDTPGHVDFSAETERVLAVLDYAILVVSAVEGVQSHTQTLWELLRRHHIPTFIVINKIDAHSADLARTMSMMRDQWSEGCIHIEPQQDLDAEDNVVSNCADDVAMLNDEAMEEALQTGSISCTWMQRLIQEEQCFPCIAVSALQQQHIDDILRVLDAWCVSPHYGDEFGAKVYRISHDPQHARLTWLKVTGGVLEAKSVHQTGSQRMEKIDQVRLYDADTFTIAQRVPAGHICAVTGLVHTAAGDGLGAEPSEAAPQLQPVLNYAVVPSDAALKYANAVDESSPQNLHGLNDPRAQQLRSAYNLYAERGVGDSENTSSFASLSHSAQSSSTAHSSGKVQSSSTAQTANPASTWNTMHQATTRQMAALPRFDDVTLHRVLEGLQELEDEDPLLHVRWVSDIQQIHIQCMGTIQQEVVISRMHERFGCDIACVPAGIVYKETIQGSVEGVGHFEPLRHYAEVHVSISGMPQNSGISYGMDIAPNTLAEQWKRLIMTHMQEREHKGVLIGAPLTDVKISAIAGKGHEKHTEGGDFRQATYRAIRQGLMQARERGKCVLLEPWYRFVLDLPQENVGRAIADIQWMHGQLESQTVTAMGTLRLEGICPVSTMSEYAVTVASYTHGEGRLATVLDGYRPCHNVEQVIAESAYNPVADLEHTPDSVFCSHGAGYPVPWDQVAEHMHIGFVLDY